MLGILTLDTAFPRIPGDVGAPETFAFPVRVATIKGALVDDVVHRRSDVLLPQFVAAAGELVEGGCIGITTTCGFLVRWQRELAAEMEVPVLTSSLLQVPLVQRCLPRHRRVGIVTYSAADLSPAALEAAGADPYTPVEGVDPRGYFYRTIRHGTAEDRSRPDGGRRRRRRPAAGRRASRPGRDRARVREHAAVPEGGRAGARTAGLRRGAPRRLVLRGHRGNARALLAPQFVVNIALLGAAVAAVASPPPLIPRPTGDPR